MAKTVKQFTEENGIQLHEFKRASLDRLQYLNENISLLSQKSEKVYLIVTDLPDDSDGAVVLEEETKLLNELNETLKKVEELKAKLNFTN